jgi:hypothetical protein
MGRSATFAAFGGLLAIASALPRSNLKIRQKPTSDDVVTVYDFADIPVTQKIEWASCFENFACTNLEVPLDYADKSAGTTNIAFQK